MSDPGEVFGNCLRLPAWCPSCGDRSLDLASEKSLQCRSCGFLYYHNVAATSSAIIETETRFLMVRRAQDPCKGMLDFPGGFIERHETAEVALRRELREELGLSYVCEPHYLCSSTNTYRYAGIDYNTIDLYYLITLPEIPPINPADDVNGFEWLEVLSFPETDIGFDSVKNACRFYNEYKRSLSGRV